MDQFVRALFVKANPQEPKKPELLAALSKFMIHKFYNDNQSATKMYGPLDL